MVSGKLFYLLKVWPVVLHLCLGQDRRGHDSKVRTKMSYQFSRHRTYVSSKNKVKVGTPDTYGLGTPIFVCLFVLTSNTSWGSKTIKDSVFETRHSNLLFFLYKTCVMSWNFSVYFFKKHRHRRHAACRRNAISKMYDSLKRVLEIFIITHYIDNIP